jgi:hypothetical protein
VEVAIPRFEPGPGGKAERHARWTIHERVQRRELRGGEVRLVDEQGGSAAAGM